MLAWVDAPIGGGARSGSGAVDSVGVAGYGATKRRERDGNGMKIDGRDDDTAVYAHGRALNLNPQQDWLTNHSHWSLC